MGADITAVFQMREGDGWKDISSDFLPVRHNSLHAWLGLDKSYVGPYATHIEPIASARGLPADFEIVGDNNHPIAGNAIRDPWSRERHRVVDEHPKWQHHFTSLRIYMGDKSLSWLTSKEILCTPTPKIRLLAYMPVKSYRSWHGGILPPSSQPLLTTDTERDDIATRDCITATTRFVAAEGDYDLAHEQAFKTFLGEIRCLQGRYGEVRMVFGFA